MSDTLIDAKVVLLHRVTIPHKESINNSNAAYVRINTSTAWVLYVDFCMLSWIKIVLDVKYTRFMENISLLSGVCKYMCYINDSLSL